ncbi:MAG TPA: PmoA family protein [Vicinamibacterales bacterium]
MKTTGSNGLGTLQVIVAAVGACAAIASVVNTVLPARAGSAGDTAPVQVIDKPDERRVDVLIDGQPFTAYLYPASLEKPVLHPIRSARGTIVTRGFPLDPRPGERADHPHHVGHWFNFGDVNGYDFWGHSSATPPERKPKAGSIVHTAITHVASGEGRGELTATANWVIPDGTVLLREETRFVFTGGPGRRAIDRTTTWTATDRAVTFGDTKEGAFGIRVARALEHPSKEREVFVNDAGEAETVPRLDNTGVTGRYLASDGTAGEAVWGTRGPWMALTGTIEGEPVTLAILDHPQNHGFPTYWHARGYGLFAANPFGQHAFDPKQPEAKFTLAPGKSLTFRHRILVIDGTVTGGAMQKEHQAFAK